MQYNVILICIQDTAYVICVTSHHTELNTTKHCKIYLQ